MRYGANALCYILADITGNARKNGTFQFIFACVLYFDLIELSRSRGYRSYRPCMSGSSLHESRRLYEF